MKELLEPGKVNFTIQIKPPCQWIVICTDRELKAFPVAIDPVEHHKNRKDETDGKNNQNGSDALYLVNLQNRSHQ